MILHYVPPSGLIIGHLGDKWMAGDTPIDLLNFGASPPETRDQKDEGNDKGAAAGGELRCREVLSRIIRHFAAVFAPEIGWKRGGGGEEHVICDCSSIACPGLCFC